MILQCSIGESQSTSRTRNMNRSCKLQLFVRLFVCVALCMGVHVSAICDSDVTRGVSCGDHDKCSACTCDPSCSWCQEGGLCSRFCAGLDDEDCASRDDCNEGATNAVKMSFEMRSLLMLPTRACRQCPLRNVVVPPQMSSWVVIWSRTRN